MKKLDKNKHEFPWFASAILGYMTWEILWLVIVRGKVFGTGVYVIFYLLDVAIFMTTSYKILPDIYARYTQQWKRFLVVGTTILFNSGLLIVGNIITHAYLIDRFTVEIKKEDSLAALTRSFFLMAISFGVWEQKYRLKRERMLAEEQRIKLSNENKILRLENELYRSQINPHFLNNSIHGILSRLSGVDKNTVEILRLWSGITRYCLTSGDELGKVPLKDDIENLKRYIRLHRILKRENFHVLLDVNNVHQETMIIPLLFIDLVDNIIKYGVYNNSSDPALIQILQQGSRFTLYTRNLKSNAGTDYASTEVGLMNLKWRLERHYPNRHKIHIENDKKYFELSLNIEL